MATPIATANCRSLVLNYDKKVVGDKKVVENGRLRVFFK